MAKTNQCIICTSLYTKNVDEMLSKGINYPTVVKFLKDKAINISTTSVYRHNKNHRKPNKKTCKKVSNKKSKKKSRKKLKPAQTNLAGAHQKEDRELAAFERDMRAIEKRKKKVLDQIVKFEQDIDVIEELALTVHLAKDRMFRAIEEEQDTKMVLAVTSGAIKDHVQALKQYHEVTAGLDSATQVRFAQLVNMVGNIFVQQPLSDKARAEMLQTITMHSLEDVNEMEEENRDKEVVEVEIKNPAGLVTSSEKS